MRWTWISHFNFRVRTKNNKVGNHHGVEGNRGHLHGQACLAMSDVSLGTEGTMAAKESQRHHGEAKGANCSVRFQIPLRMRNVKTGDSHWTG